jgi:isoleucyl-tRNA synthetase
VFDLNGNTRTLSEDEYEIVYEGIDGDSITIEGNMVIKLDLELTESLKREGIARELSRFLNQMRKDADFAVDARVQMKYETTDEELKKLIEEFSEFFQEEALLQRLEVGTPNGDAVAEFESDGKKVQISLSR